MLSPSILNRSAVALAVLSLSAACVQVTINNVNGPGDAGAGTPGSSGIRAGDAASGPEGITVVPPKPTDSIALRGNLDQTALPMSWDAWNPKGTSNFTTSLAVYDSVGKAIQLDFYFCKNDASRTENGDSGDWTYHVMTDGGNIATDETGSPGMVGTPAEIAAGTLRFDTQGRLISNLTTIQAFNPAGAVNPQALIFNFGSGTEPVAGVAGNGLDGLTQYAATSAICFASQNGSPFIAYP